MDTMEQIVKLYGTPEKYANELISDALYHGYEGDMTKLDSAKSFVLSNITEILRNCIDHNEPVKGEFYKEVEHHVNHITK